MSSDPRLRAWPRRVVVKVLAVGALSAIAAAGLFEGSATSSAHGVITLSAVHRPALVSKATRLPDCRRLKCVALTFDDGPGPETTRLLTVLHKAHVRATFFMVGIQVQAFPAIAHQVARFGHELADHTWDHQDLTRMSPHQVRVEILRTRNEIKRATGRSPQLFRPPYGSTTHKVAVIAGQIGMPEVLWDVDTDDWLYRHANVVQRNAVGAAFPGAIILMHDIYSSTVDAVPGIIKQLRARGYTFVTVSQMFGTMKPGVEYFGRPR